VRGKSGGDGENGQHYYRHGDVRTFENCVRKNKPVREVIVKEVYKDFCQLKTKRLTAARI
jgi:hypothetical protein